MMRHIMVATDGSESARHAVHFAADLAAQTGARLSIAHVLPPLNLPPEVGAIPDYLEALERARQEEAELLLQRECAACVGERPISVQKLLLQGSIAQVIEEAAEEQQVDLLVVGTRGCGAIKRALVGSVSSKLAHICERPLAIVP